MDFHIKDHSDIPVEKEYFHTWDKLEMAAIEFAARRYIYHKKTGDNWSYKSSANHFMMLKDDIVERYGVDEFDLMGIVRKILNGDFYKMTPDDCIKEWKECVENGLCLC